MKYLFQKILRIDLKTPFPRISYEESMARFGTDKPDTRFGLELNEITNVFRNTAFKVFGNVVAQNGYIGALVIPDYLNGSQRVSTA
jgi:aspartyl-tRNA synthetase